MKLGLFQILFLPFRYLMAVVVSYFVSVVTFVGILNLLDARNPDPDSAWGFVIGSAWLAVVGFVGVFSGSFCLPRSHRWLGSIFLLLLGIGFSSFWFVLISFGPSINFAPFNAASFLQVINALCADIPLAIGGSIPVVIHYLRRPRGAHSIMDHKEVSH